MKLLRSLSELRTWRVEDDDAPLHFVPTMGALHRGHQALLRRAARLRHGQQPRVLLSVFVNPLQFGPGEDYHRYPRDLEGDLALAENAGADALFAPLPDDLFPGGSDALTRVSPPAALQEGLCGRSRPGHFDGVATVVCRLLALTRPDRLFLGEKDWQQLVILRTVVSDLGLPVSIEGCATVRDDDGLACSSRNRYLSLEERSRAVVLPRALAAVLERHRRQDAGEGPSLVAELRRQLKDSGLSIEYAELVRAHSLRPVTRVDGLTLLAAAVRCGAGRLIDHVFLMSRPPIVAIDGPAGAGKSTVSRALAHRLGLVYLDTGAMYRALTWWVLHRGVDPAVEEEVGRLLDDLDLQLRSGAPGGQEVVINGNEVSEAIRSPEVTARVSTVAAHPCVREALTRLQRSMGRRGGLVAEGRDIGTAVFPDADCKVFLTASVAERARRRAEDLRNRGFSVPSLEELRTQIAERDHLDASREVAPLCQAADAMELITDGMGIDRVIESLVELFRVRVPEDAWPDRSLPGLP